MLGGGGTGATARSHIGRLNADGSLDTSFNPGANASVRILAVQSDGKIVGGGQFTTLGGGGSGTTPRNYLGRLYLDGSADATMNPGTNAIVRAMAVQPDGKMLIGGEFTSPRGHLGRLNPDGTLDAGFDPGANGTVAALAVQADGKILVAGDFSTLGGGGSGTTTRLRIGRLNADGSLDGTFNPGANGYVRSVVLQPDGNIVFGGDFNGLGGGTGSTSRYAIGRVGPDGSLDASFNPGANGIVSGLALQPDGKIVVGGAFTGLGGGLGTTSRSKIGRLNADGSIDTAFDPGANGIVRAVTLQADGRILLGGEFTMLGGGGTGTTPATIWRGPTPTAHWTSASIPARTIPSAPSRCSRIDGSSRSASSRCSAAAVAA